MFQETEPMRFPLAAAVLCFSASLALAQNPQPAPPAQPAQQDPVDIVLERWEKAMAAIDMFEAECNMTIKDKVFSSVEKHEGRVRFTKGNVAAKTPAKASLELVRKDRPEVYQKLICTGASVFEYVPSEKVIRVHELPKNTGLGDESFLQFAFGMKAVDAKSRFKMVYAGRDDHYYYLDVFPTQQRDMAEFTKCRLVFLSQTGLPRQIWMLKPNQNEQTWDFPRVNPQAQLAAAAFTTPQLPQGWQWQRMPQPGQNPPNTAPMPKPTVRFNNGN